MNIRKCPFCGTKGIENAIRPPPDGDCWWEDGYEPIIHYGCHECDIWFKSLDKWNSRYSEEVRREA